MLRAVDYFAGAGGWTLGASDAGLRVVAAVNHWAVAVASHRANHPDAEHYCQDAALLDPATLPAHDVLIASPSCTGHTPARGKDRPKHDADRATAWCVVNAAEVTRPRLILVENVVAMRSWALYPSWCDALARLGYTLTENVLDAADFGVPQHRVRLFIVATRGRRAQQVTPPVRQQARPRPVRDVVNFNAGDWSPVAGHALRTLARIAAGRREFGARFLTAYYGSEDGGRSLDRPLGTITTHDRYALVDGDRMRMLIVDELRAAMGFPAGYVLTGNRADQVKQLGNAVVPVVAAEVVRQALDTSARRAA